jgi:hypothetical protein
MCAVSSPETQPSGGPPLRDTALQALPVGAVVPSGWLRRQLRLQADGLTGQLERIWPDVGPGSGWLGGDGEDWERGPYYCDGLIPLAYLLNDEPLIAKARRWVEWTLGSQRPDGRFGPLTNDDWWPRMVMLKALIQYHEATGDIRVLPFMTRYFHYQAAALPRHPLSDWGEARGADNLLTVYWLYERTHDATLLELADLLLEQTLDWENFLAPLPARERVTVFSHYTHVVNVAMGLKTAAFRYPRDGQVDHLSSIRLGFADLMRYHGQIQGMFSGDEWLAGTGPDQGVELCAVVECMFTLEQLVRIYGEGEFADRLEMLAYNALAATITADLIAHQYDQQPNQVLCTVAPRNWTANDDTSNIFGLEPHFGCCTANMHQGWPKFTASLWMASPDGGLAAVAYAPCTVTTRLADGAEPRIEEQTDYPFEETTRLKIHLSTAASFPLHLRIPGWCKEPQLLVNGEQQPLHRSQSGFVALRRVWHDGDVVELTLPMEIRPLPGPGGGQGVALGPLVLALRIGEEWRRLPDSPGLGDWEVRPTTPWNYALSADPGREPERYTLHRGPVGEMPFAASAAPIRVLTAGQRVPEWTILRNSAGPVPDRVRADPALVETITLVPYGCARLRIAEFPLTVGAGCD